MFSGLYSDERAAQVAAYMVSKAGGAIELLALTKLLYLAERRSYELFGEPLIGDRPYSMQHGPVLSATLNNTKATEPPNEVWAGLFASRDGNIIRLSRELKNPAGLLKLSRADFAVLDEIWGQFGHMTSSQLRKYTHDSCPEYDESCGTSSLPIEPDELLTAVGFTPDQVKEREAHLRAMGRIDRVFKSQRN